jgi:hypothetical protein
MDVMDVVIECYIVTLLLLLNVMDVIQHAAEIIGAPHAMQSVDDAYRVFANPKNVRKASLHPILIIKFKTVEAKKAWLNREKTVNLTDGKICGNDNNNKIRIYDQLTSYYKQLLWKTKVAAKEKNYTYTWSKNRKIFTKENDTKGTIRIRCARDINRLIRGVAEVSEVQGEGGQG